jgi:hypothetical protein
VSGLVYKSIKVAEDIYFTVLISTAAPPKKLRRTLVLTILTLKKTHTLTKSTMSESATNGAPVKKQLILNAFVESCKLGPPS